jgi:hypothetical protein
MGKKRKSNHSRNTHGRKNAPGQRAAASKPAGASAKNNKDETKKSSLTTAAKATEDFNASKKAAEVSAASEAAAVDVAADGNYEQVQSAGTRVKVIPDGLLPISFVGGLLGMLIGILPATIWMIIFRSVFYPLFMLVPVFIYGGITLFRGCRDTRAVILTGVLSLAGAYLTAVFCQSAAYVAKYKMSAINIPYVAADLIGKKGSLPDPFFSTAGILPLVFTVMGFFVAMLLFQYNHEVFTDVPSAENQPPVENGQDDRLHKAN